MSPDRWDDMQIARERREALVQCELAHARLAAAMIACGIPVPANATGNELLDILDEHTRAKLRRLGR